ncbi:MAG: alpha/beta hydrolase [Puniceicoccales bacterium]
MSPTRHSGKNRRFTLGLFFLANALTGFAAETNKIEIYSESMDKNIPAMAILPDSYAESTETYPVVYLLHGKGGAFSHWQNAAPLTALSDQYQMIIICPDGDNDSWYLDSPERSESQYMTYLVDEVVPYVDQVFRTKANSANRAISGNSMGGHGALLAALKNPGIFGAAGSMSGVLDLRPYAHSSLGKSISKRIGSFEEYPDRWDEVSVRYNLPALEEEPLAIIIECGTADHFIKTNRAIHKALIEAKVDHTYIESTGGHNWGFWKNAVKFQMLFFHEYFSRNPEE